MDYSRFLNILAGRYDHLPKQSSRQVRIFLSSTFTGFADSHEERDYLIQHVYPRLRNYCKLQHGLDFQVLDMRWGISHEVTNTHMATTICLNEVRASQKLSIGPNFIAFLSHRYGARCLPTRIIADEFEIMRAEMKNYPDMDFGFTGEFEGEPVELANVIEDCYILDQNETPARYRLKYISAIIPNYKSEDKECLAVWAKIEEKLGKQMRTMANICFEKKLFTKTQHERYFVSVTEKEIFNGIINAKNVPNNVLLFVREIEDVKEYKDVDKSIAWRYIDVDDANQIDESAQRLLDDLKNSKLAKKVPESNTFRFKVKWAPGKGVTAESHPEYMKEFGETFFEQVKRLIDRNQAQASFYENLEPRDAQLLQEVLEHAYFCNESVAKFHGRVDLLDRMKEYLTGQTTGPLVLHGPSGCGKTAILAKLTSEILKSVPDPSNYSIVLRFLGTTPATSTIAGTLNSVFYQISRVFNLKPPGKYLAESFQLRDYLLDQLVLLNSLHPSKKLVIVLDSIDQLNTKDYRLDWLLDEFPSNVRVIFSTLPDHGLILESFRARKTLGPANFLEIDNLNQATARAILADWLAKVGRSLAPHQWLFIDKLLAKAQLFPLYVKLLFDIVSKWHSYYEPERNKSLLACINIDNSIEYLFKLLETDHGQVLFSRAVIYMTAFRNGISEGELEDILSLDDDVLYDIFKFHAPPVRKLPSALWSRIKYDLNEYLVEKEVDDTKVLNWYHRRFIEVSNTVYLDKIASKDKEAIFGNVVDFFNETWKHKPKPYRYNDYLTKKKKLASSEAEAVRDTTLQPTAFVDADGNVRYNKRKIRELPNFILQLTRGLSYVFACDHVLFDYHFLYGMFEYTELPEIVHFIGEIGANSNYQVGAGSKEAIDSIRVMFFAILQTIIALKDHPRAIGPLLLSRVLVYHNTFRYFTKLVDECDRLSPRNCALTAPYAYTPVFSNNCLFGLERHTRPIVAACYVENSTRSVFTLSDDKLHLLKVDGVSELGELRLGNRSSEPYVHLVVHLAESYKDEVASIKELRGGFVVASRREILSGSLDTGAHYFRKKFDDDEAPISDLFLVSPNHVLVVYEARDYVDLYNMFTGDLALRKRFEAPVRRAAVSTYKGLTNNVYSLRLEHETLVAVALALTGEVRLLSVNFELIGATALDDNNLKITEKSVVPASGFECVDVQFLEDGDNPSFEPTRLFVSFEHGQIALLDLDSTPAELKYVKFKDARGLRLRLAARVGELDDDEGLIMLDSTGSLFVELLDWTSKDDKDTPAFIEIRGHFDTARWVRPEVLIAVSGNACHYFVLNLDTKRGLISYTEAAKFEAHYDQITSVKITEDLLITTSRDGSLKIFILHSLDDESIGFDYDRAENNIQALVEVDSSTLASVAQNSGTVDVWNLSTGRILKRIRTDEAERVVLLFHVDAKRFVVVSERIKGAKKSSGHVIRGFDLERKGEDQVRFKLTVTGFKRSKLLQASRDRREFVLLSQPKDAGEVQVDTVRFGDVELVGQRTLDAASARNRLRLLPDLSAASPDLLENACLLDASDLESASVVAVFADLELVVFDPRTRVILARTSLLDESRSIDYFLSPTNLQANRLLSVARLGSAVVCVNNVGNLLLAALERHGSEANRLGVVSSANTGLKFDGHALAVVVAAASADEELLLAHDVTNNIIVLYDARLARRAGSFRSAIRAKVALKDAELHTLGFSPDASYAYSVENSRVLKFFSLKRGGMRLVGELPLYSTPICCLCTREYVAFSMQDKRVISLLITDPEDPEHQAKIGRLESRRLADVEQTEKVRKAAVKLAEKLDDSEDEDVLAEYIYSAEFESFNLVGAEEKLRALRAEERPDSGRIKSQERQISIYRSAKKLRAKSKSQKPLPVFFENKKFLSEMKPNWALELLRKKKLISETLYDERKAILGARRLDDQDEDQADSSDDESVVRESAEFQKGLLDILVANAQLKTGPKTRNSGRSVSVTNASAGSAACNVQ